MALAVVGSRGVGTVLGANARLLYAFVNICTCFTIAQESTKKYNLVKDSTVSRTTLHSLVSLVTVTVETGLRVHAFVSAAICLHLGAFVHIAMQWLIRIIPTIRHLIADQVGINTLSIGALELADGTSDIGLFAVHLVGMVPTIIFAIASILIANALEVLASELVGGARLVLVVAHLSFIRSVATIVVMVTDPPLEGSQSVNKTGIKPQLPSILTSLIHLPLAHVNCPSPQGAGEAQ